MTLHCDTDDMLPLLVTELWNQQHTESAHTFAAQVQRDLQKPASTVARAVATVRFISSRVVSNASTELELGPMCQIVRLLRCWKALSSAETRELIDIFRTSSSQATTEGATTSNLLFEGAEYLVPVAKADCLSNRYRPFCRQLHHAILSSSPVPDGHANQIATATRDIIAFPGTYHITLPWLLKMFLSFSTLVVITVVNSKLINRNSKSPLDLDEQNKRDVAGLTNLFAVLLAIFVIWQIAAGLWTRNYVAAFMLGTEHAYSSRTLTRTKFVWIWLVSGVLMLALAAIAGLVVVSLSVGSLLHLLAALSAAGLVMWLASLEHFVAALFRSLPDTAWRGQRVPFRASVAAQQASWWQAVPFKLTLNASLAQIVVGFVCLMYFGCSKDAFSKNALLDKWSFHLFHVAFAPHGLELIAFVPHWFGVTLPRMRWLWLIYIVVFIWLPSKTSQLTEDGSIQSIFDDVSHLTADLGITTVIWNAIVFGFIVRSVAAFETTVVSTPRVIFSAYIIDVFSYFERLRDVCTFKFDRSGLSLAELQQHIEHIFSERSGFRADGGERRFHCMKVNDGFLVNECSFGGSQLSVDIFRFELANNDVLVTWVAVLDDGNSPLNPPEHRGRRNLQQLALKFDERRPWSTAFKPDKNRISPLQTVLHGKKWFKLCCSMLRFREQHGKWPTLSIEPQCDLDSVFRACGWSLVNSATTTCFSKVRSGDDTVVVQCVITKTEHALEVATTICNNDNWHEAFADLQCMINHVWVFAPASAIKLAER